MYELGAVTIVFTRIYSVRSQINSGSCCDCVREFKLKSGSTKVASFCKNPTNRLFYSPTQCLFLALFQTFASQPARMYIPQLTSAVAVLAADFIHQPY